MAVGSGPVGVALGYGDGTFFDLSGPAVSGTVRSVTVGDFNGDGKADIAVAADLVNLLLGNGTGVFQSTVRYTAGTSPYSLVAADYNGDGWPDLVVANNGSNDASMLLNLGCYP